MVMLACGVVELGACDAVLASCHPGKLDEPQEDVKPLTSHAKLCTHIFF